MAFLGAVVVAFGVVFVAELGDKTQLLALNFGARYPLRVVIVGLTLGYAAAGAVAAVVGGLLGAALPDRPLAIGGGIVFLVFAVLSLREGVSDETTRIVRTSSMIASIAITIALAEFGDKTQLATATLAAVAIRSRRGSERPAVRSRRGSSAPSPGARSAAGCIPMCCGTRRR